MQNVELGPEPRGGSRAARGAPLKARYDFIVCGSGSSGSVVARRLAENADVSVLLVEAGGDDDLPEVMDPGRWPSNLRSERVWSFLSEPSPHLNGRSVPVLMGKVLGGGSSVNVLCWSRGHQNDWDHFASEAGDAEWSYASVLGIYHRVEDWHGASDPRHRGSGGPMFVEPAPDPNPLAPATLEGARAVGIPTFENANGRLMEGAGGSSISDLIEHDEKRQSVFRSYVAPFLGRPNLTVLPRALVTCVTFERAKASGVEISCDDKIYRISAEREVVLSLGAINTPRVLMQSRIGDQAELRRFGIAVLSDVPGVGQNAQDHVGLTCVWEYREALPPRNNMSEAVLFWRSTPGLVAPDLYAYLAEIPMASAEIAAKFGMPTAGYTLFGAVAQPKSRGRIRLTGPSPLDPIRIEANLLSGPEDLKTAIACVELCREVGNTGALRPFAKREVMPGDLKGAELEDYVRDAAVTYWHTSCTAKMGRDAMSVVDGNLKVHGVENLRIADSSIMPRITTGNTMAPCVVIGERAAEILKTAHGL
jgi:choline dehydrogenase